MISEKEQIYREYLVFHCQHRDKQAWGELIDLYDDRLFYFIKQLVGQHHDALNVLQDTWLKAYRTIHRLRQPASLTPWLYKIARNMAFKTLSSRRRVLSFEDFSVAQLPSADAETEDTYAAEQVHEGLKHLSLPHREVLVLYYLENGSLRQIAEILGVPIGTVRSRLHYAKRSLKTILEKERENGTFPDIP